MYNLYQLDEIDFSNFDHIHSREVTHGTQDHSRWVYRNVDDNLYYKVWNTTYVRKDNIIAGLNSKFYDSQTVPALHGVIYHEDICRGYIMKGVNKNTKDSSNFYELIKQKTDSTGYFYFDYCEQHIMDYKDQFCLIDLEGIYPLSELQNFLDHKYYSSFADNNYKEFVCSIMK